MFVESSRIGDDRGNVFSNILDVGQSKRHVPIVNDSMINIDGVGVIGPTRWDLGDKNLEIATNIDDGIRETCAVDCTKNLNFLFCVIS